MAQKVTVSRRTLLQGTAAAAAVSALPHVAATAEASEDTAHIRDCAMIKKFYAEFPKRMARVRAVLNRPLTLTEKIIYTHLYHQDAMKDFARGKDYIELRPDRAGTHDIGGPMAIIQFLTSKKERIALPAAMVCDHLVQANRGAIPDLKVADKGNWETYSFLRTVSGRYGFDFWPAGSGICHQVFLENYDFPGGMMLVTDSHTPTACGLGMLAIGVGGADLVDALMGMEWELKMPKIIGVKLTGKLNGWASPKDVILKVAGILTTKGGTNSIIEFFGQGTESLSCTGKATICNMGAEVGATTTVFGYDDAMKRYLTATGRAAVAAMADKVAKDLQADDAVIANPEKYAIVADILRGDDRSGCMSVMDRAADVEDAFRDLLNDLDIATGLSNYGVKREDLPACADRAFAAKRLLNNNPRAASRDQILALLEANFEA